MGPRAGLDQTPGSARVTSAALSVGVSICPMGTLGAASKDPARGVSPHGTQPETDEREVLAPLPPPPPLSPLLFTDVPAGMGDQ